MHLKLVDKKECSYQLPHAEFIFHRDNLSISSEIVGEGIYRHFFLNYFEGKDICALLSGDVLDKPYVTMKEGDFMAAANLSLNAPCINAKEIEEVAKMLSNDYSLHLK
ncbi:MAG: hypothetical protein HQK84_03050 [Nitrospinae bacterium]|nr:hypothetical protein [Nitrospinota bacterium]